MTGFRLPERIVEFEFEGEYAGAVIRARVSPIPMGTFLEIVTLLGGGTSDAIAKARDAWAAVALVDWNLLTPGGEPIPATAEGAQALTVEVIAATIGAWAREVSDLPLPLLRRSGSGDTSEAVPA